MEREYTGLIALIVTAIFLCLEFSGGVPQPCEEGSKTITISAQPGESRRISLCVVSSPDISTYAIINGERVRAMRQDEQRSWVWNFENSNINSSLYNVSITINNITSENYTTHSFAISTSKEQRDMLNYTIVLKHAGPPDCPIHIAITEVGVHYVTLTWQPGFNGGFNQSFQVRFSKLSSNSSQTVDANHGNFYTVSNLEGDTFYTFKIEPRSEIGINSSCKTAEVKTLAETITLSSTIIFTEAIPTTSSSTDPSVNPAHPLPYLALYMLLGLGVPLVLGAGIIGVIVYFKKRGIRPDMDNITVTYSSPAPEQANWSDDENDIESSGMTVEHQYSSLLY